MNVDVKQKLKKYPEYISVCLMAIRALIYSVADQYKIDDIEESVKWGEPSYSSKMGSSIRFDWKPKAPDQYCIYFNCKTKLIDTFKEVYGDTFEYEGNRAIIFKNTDIVPVNELTHCVAMSLRYKKIKHLELLGA